MFCPVFSHHSIICLRSRKSPHPKSSSERRANTGIAVPAPRQSWRGLRNVRLPRRSVSPLSSAQIPNTRLAPSSHATTSDESFLTIRNLYSIGIASLSAGMLMFQKGNSASLRRSAWAGFQLPSVSHPPAMARISSGRTIGAATRMRSCPGNVFRGWSVSRRISIPSVKADV